MRTAGLLLFIGGTALAQQLPTIEISSGDQLASDIAQRIQDERGAAKARAIAMIGKAKSWMLAGQDASGGFGVREGAPVFPAVTALCVMGLIDKQTPASDPAMARAAAYVVKFQKEDGAICDVLLPSYNTAIAVSMLARFSDSASVEATRKGAEFLKGLQYGEGAVESARLGAETAKPVGGDHAFYGGVGYGKHGRPDLSNTAFWVEALKDAGVDRDDPAFKRAIVFLQRTQQLQGVNDMPYGKDSKQGGFIYATSENSKTIGSGQSFAGDIAESLSGPPGVRVIVKLRPKDNDGKPVLLSRDAILKRITAQMMSSSLMEIAAIGDDVQVLVGPGESSGCSAFEIRAKCEAAERFTSLVGAAFRDEIGEEGSFAGEAVTNWRAESRLRAYGSMTYAGFKSYLYAGLSKNDPRVAAARGWIESHYTLAENPGVGTDGLYYYYVMFAKALDADGRATVLTPDGSRDWRIDLVNQLSSLQNEDGSFRSVDDRWMENDPVLITAYALNALQLASKSLGE